MWGPRRSGTVPVTLAGLALVGIVLTACGGSAQQPADAEQPASPEPTVTAPGPNFGLCGAVTDDELTQATGMTGDVRAVRDPVGCQWDQGMLGDGTHVSFTWYRGSPIGRERAIDEAVGRDVRDVTVGGLHGFSSALLPGLCEVGVQAEGDFFLWSIDYGADSGRLDGSVCDTALQLATMTAERAR